MKAQTGILCSFEGGLAADALVAAGLGGRLPVARVQAGLGRLTRSLPEAHRAALDALPPLTVWAALQGARTVTGALKEGDRYRWVPTRRKARNQRVNQPKRNGAAVAWAFTFLRGDEADDMVVHAPVHGVLTFTTDDAAPGGGRYSFAPSPAGEAAGLTPGWLDAEVAQRLVSYGPADLGDSFIAALGAACPNRVRLGSMGWLVPQGERGAYERVAEAFRAAVGRGRAVFEIPATLGEDAGAGVGGTLAAAVEVEIDAALQRANALVAAAEVATQIRAEAAKAGEKPKGTGKDGPEAGSLDALAERIEATGRKIAVYFDAADAAREVYRAKLAALGAAFDRIATFRVAVHGDERAPTPALVPPDEREDAC